MGEKVGQKQLECEPRRFGHWLGGENDGSGDGDVVPSLRKIMIWLARMN